MLPPRAGMAAGLGLAISRKLVERMNGEIWVESPWRDETGAEQQGSAFHFTAILGKAAAAVSVASAVEPSGDLRALRILLAEDNDISRKLACRLLERNGHSVSVATNGREASICGSVCLSIWF
jgi:hypothetical protein